MNTNDRVDRGARRGEESTGRKGVRGEGKPPLECKINKIKIKKRGNTHV